MFEGFFGKLLFRIVNIYWDLPVGRAWWKIDSCDLSEWIFWGLCALLC